MSKLRPYQYNLTKEIYSAWGSGAKVVMPVLPTGAGKTVVIGGIVRDYDDYSISSAHRKELIAQISTALAREGVYHDLLTTDRNSTLRRHLSNLHLKKVGRNFISDRAKAYVGGIDTIINMRDDPRIKRAKMWVSDEGHHVTKLNKWGRFYNEILSPDCYALLPTATPRRADGLGLGRHADGIVDILIEGVAMRPLINMGYLTDYKVVCEKASDLDMSDVDLGSDGDYNVVKMRKAVKRSKKIVGDVVRHYLTHARGKLGITFAVDVEAAATLAQAYRDAGIPAEVIHGGTPEALRTSLLEKFERREILQLVNVDLFGEGFDMPAVEVVSMARPTKSFSLFCQQFGRALRLMISDVLAGAWDTYTDAQRVQFIRESMKPFALIIDHVGNIVEHKFPDAPQIWTTDRREKRAKGTPDDAIPLRSCLGCYQPYERTYTSCPYCGEDIPEPGTRNGPQFVDGDLQLLDFATLAELRGDVAHVDKVIDITGIPKNVSAHAKTAIIRNHVDRQHAQTELRESIALWAGQHQRPEREVHKLFWFKFGTTVLHAKSLSRNDADALRNKILLTLPLHH